jgi:hypothetical protein
MQDERQMVIIHISTHERPLVEPQDQIIRLDIDGIESSQETSLKEILSAGELST